MPQHICNGTMMCSFSVARSALTVLPHGGEAADEQPMATVMDHQPSVSILPAP